ncbi:MAG: hypothetical protein JOZ73_12450 [Solirubrobacterales bacterium]|nr:hypothetical protein [Solirubrobacterales bacterium]
MAWKHNVLVVANITSTSPELIDQLKARAEREQSSFTLIVPAGGPGGREAAKQKLREALDVLREAGLEADGSVGPPDSLVAVTEAWDPRRYDEIIVSTLPMKFSKWLHAGLPERVEKATGAVVTHVIAQPPHPEIEPVQLPPHEKDALGPLSVLGWGRPKER